MTLTGRSGSTTEETLLRIVVLIRALLVFLHPLSTVCLQMSLVLAETARLQCNNHLVQTALNTVIKGVQSQFFQTSFGIQGDPARLLPLGTNPV